MEESEEESEQEEVETEDEEEEEEKQTGASSSLAEVTCFLLCMFVYSTVVQNPLFTF